MQSNQIDQLIHSQKWSELSDYLQGCSFADDNTQSQKNTLHLGFTQEGVLRSHVIRPDTSETLDLIINGYLANEFFQNPRILKLFTRVLG